MSALAHSLSFTENYLDWGLLISRFTLATVFASHGWYKSFGKQGFVESARRYAFHGIPFPLFFSYFVAVSQLVAVPFLLLGFLTRWLAFFLLLQMIVATWAKYRENGIFDGADLPMSTGALCLLLFILGPGAFALDAFL